MCVTLHNMTCVTLRQVRCFSAIGNCYLLFFSLIFFFLQHCGSSEPSSPLLLMERLSFEMHKTYTETRLQLHLSPATIVLVDGNEVSKQSNMKLCGQR